MPFYSLPSTNCPCCNNKAILTELKYGCKNCGSFFEVDITLLQDKIFISKKDNDKIKDSIEEAFEKSEKKKKEILKQLDEYDAIEDLAPIYNRIFQGAMLETLKTMKKTYGFKNLDETLFFCIATSDFILKAMRSLHGNRVFLVDDQGAKTQDLKKAILRNNKDFLHELQNKDISDAFIEQMIDIFKVHDIERQKLGEDQNNSGN